MQESHNFKIVGLTGGIGSGKSTVAALFRKFNVHTVDADQMTRDLLKTQPSVLTSIIHHFGQAFLNEKGELNREKLKVRIFASPTDRIWLENLLHPIVKNEIQMLRTKTPAGQYCIVEIPLLIETQFEAAVDRVLVVDCPEETQMERVAKRDGLGTAEIKAIMQTQAERTERLLKADDIIMNTGSLAALTSQVLVLQEKYSLFAKSLGEPSS